MKALKCLVTGGAGFIGSHLVTRLLEEGNSVIVIDNFSTGRQQNLSHCKDNPGLSLVRADISDVKNIAGYFKDIDIVFHLAALADIVPSIVNPVAYYNSNVTGTLCVAEACRLSAVKRIVYAASSSCYGITDVYPTPETQCPEPQYPYALTKYLGEQILLHWARVYKLPVISLRLFNVYGERSRTSGTYGAVLGVFLAQKLHAKPFTIVGDGNQKRDFIYVSDVVGAFIAAGDSQVRNEIFNVGSGNPQSINTLASFLGGEKTYVPKRPGEPQCTWADISKIKRMLGWQPKVTLEQGLKKILENIEYWKDAPVWTPEKIEEATKDWFRYLSCSNA
jgi:UDP-glucose 4-epimerase